MLTEGDDDEEERYSTDTLLTDVVAEPAKD
jgi:hypothetical protein